MLVDHRHCALDNVEMASSVPLLNCDDVEELIAAGKAIVIVDDYVLKVDPWLPYHPGGDKAIRHMVGRDATDEVNW